MIFESNYYNTFVNHHQVLMDIINEFKFERILELGVYKARTSRWLLRTTGVREYWGVDRFDDFPMTSDSPRWKEYYKMACRYMVLYPSFHLLRLESAEAASLFPDGHFDFVYIDSDHSYEGVKRDLELWYPKVRKGFLLGGHDYGGRYEGVKKAVDEMFENQAITVFPTAGVWITWR